jgi:hypothetical protein
MFDRHGAKFKAAHRHSMALAHIDRARHTSSNGGSSAKALQGIKHLPDSLPSKLHWREKIKGWWYRFEREWEPVTVNKSIDSVTMPKWIAIGIFTAMLAFLAQSWRESSAQRDIMIEMKTELRLMKESKTVEDAERKALSAEEKAWREIMHGNQKKIEGMLTQQQLDALDRVRRNGREN